MNRMMIVSDESVNQYGFRVLSSGGDFTRFKKNPIMLYVHERTAAGKAKYPIGKWEDLQVVGDEIHALPVFNEQNEDGKEAKLSFDGGFLNAASIHIDPIEWSEDPALMLPGQMLPTVTKWVLLEISMADIPVNGNAVRLTHHGRSIALSSDPGQAQDLHKLFYPTNKPSMKSIIAVLNSNPKLGLSLADTSNETEVVTAINKVLTQHADVLTAKETLITQLTSERDGLKLAKETAETAAKNEKATLLVEGAISSKKITADKKEHFVKLALADYDTTKTILDGMQGYTPVLDQLTKTTSELSLEEQIKKHDELFKTGKLAALKSSNWDEYATLHKAKYGKEPKK